MFNFIMYEIYLTRTTVSIVSERATILCKISSEIKLGLRLDFINVTPSYDLL